jgi:hypothetical protein
MKQIVRTLWFAAGAVLLLAAVNIVMMQLLHGAHAKPSAIPLAAFGLTAMVAWTVASNIHDATWAGRLIARALSRLPSG